MPASAVEVKVPVVVGIVATKTTLTAEFTDGRTVSVPLDWYPRLVHGAPEERNNVELYGDGTIHWPDLDEDISVEGLLAGRRSLESEASFERWLAARRAGRGLTLKGTAWQRGLRGKLFDKRRRATRKRRARPNKGVNKSKRGIRVA